MHLEFFTDDNGGHRWRLRGDNGEIVAISKSYTEEREAHHGAADLFRGVYELTSQWAEERLLGGGNGGERSAPMPSRETAGAGS